MTGPAELLRRLEQDGPTDRELLARFAGRRDDSPRSPSGSQPDGRGAGDGEAAFAELVRRHGPVVLGACRRVTGHPQDAEDAFQAVFLVLARKAASLGNPDLLGNWLYGVAVRVARKARRSAARRRAREVAVSVMPDPPARPVTPAPELGPILDEELAALPAWYRDAILLCDLRGVSREEAAALLGVPEGTLSSRLANGRKKLAARLTKRGVTLSAATVPTAVAEAARASPVPNELVAKTCGLVADWSAGGAVPGPVARLAEGGFAVRKLLILGVLTVAVAGTVFAASSRDDAPRTDPPKPAPVAAKGEPAPTPEQKPDPKADEKPARFTNTPKLRTAIDLRINSLNATIDVAWSPDGKSLIVKGPSPNPDWKGRDAAVILTDVLDPEKRNWWEYPLEKSATVARYMPDGRIVTDNREYHLLSGRHVLYFHEFDKGFQYGLKQVGRVELEAADTYGYAFAADGKTFRTVGYERDKRGNRYRDFSVRSVDLTTGKTLKTLVTAEGEFLGFFALSQDGKRLGLVDAFGNLVVYDVDSAKKLWTKSLTEAENKLVPVRSLRFSPDGRRLAVFSTEALHVFDGSGRPILKWESNTERYFGPPSFTADGRLLASSLDHGVGGPAEFLCVWDIDAGKILKRWDRKAQVAFHPTKPILAILEPNGEDTTRLGLWDFAAEVEKK
jgi:RNA polymerase sigma factor (sigma-70 family)